ncbi:MAG: ArdC-like ssDNA-binding domain-containing protein [Pseudonocardiaceae bacterium]
MSHLETTTSPKLLRYSVHNVATLTKQAQERGIMLSDVDSFRGWSECRRGVRKGERGLRTVAPQDVQTTPATPNQTQQSPPKVNKPRATRSAFDSAWLPCSTSPKPRAPRTVRLKP